MKVKRLCYLNVGAEWAPLITCGTETKRLGSVCYELTTVRENWRIVGNC